MSLLIDKVLSFGWAAAQGVERRVRRAKAQRVLKSLARCGRGVRIHGRIWMSGAEKAVIGEDVHIGDNAFIRADGGLEIGPNTHISRNLVLYTVNHRFRDCQHLPYDGGSAPKPVSIGRNVWIGMNVCIAPGTRIGDGAIVGMGAVVSGEVPSCAIVGAQPVRILGWRDRAHYARLDAASPFSSMSRRAPSEQAAG